MFVMSDVTFLLPAVLVIHTPVIACFCSGANCARFAHLWTTQSHNQLRLGLFNLKLKLHIFEFDSPDENVALFLSHPMSIQLFYTFFKNRFQMQTWVGKSGGFLQILCECQSLCVWASV